MNEEKWVLAVLKRKLLELKSKAELYTERDIYENILDIIATAESDAILGTQELAEEFANKLADTLRCHADGSENGIRCRAWYGRNH